MDQEWVIFGLLPSLDMGAVPQVPSLISQHPWSVFQAWWLPLKVNNFVSITFIALDRVKVGKFRIARMSKNSSVNLPFPSSGMLQMLPMLIPGKRGYSWKDGYRTSLQGAASEDRATPLNASASQPHAHPASGICIFEPFHPRIFCLVLIFCGSLKMVEPNVSGTLQNRWYLKTVISWF